jgi:hypothetical protein
MNLHQAPAAAFGGGGGGGLVLSSRAAREDQLRADGIHEAYLPYDGAALGGGTGPSRMSARLNFNAKRL